MSVAEDVEAGEPQSKLVDLPIESVVANDRNPRLDFPRSELERLAESIDQEGILVPIVVFKRDDKYVLVDGERRFRCATELGLTTVPALITTERPEREVLQQMFNIHLIREPWRDVPTAIALGRLSSSIKEETGDEPSDKDLADMTGLSIDRVRQLRYVLELPEDWQKLIREGHVPLNYFWELKKNVIDQLRARRPALLTEIGEDTIRNAFVQKRLDGVITDTVSLRKVAPIIKFAEQESKADSAEAADIEATIRDLINDPTSTIDDAYDETVQMLVEVDKLGRRTASMTTAFKRLLAQAASPEDKQAIVDLGREFIAGLSEVLDGADGAGD